MNKKEFEEKYLDDSMGCRTLRGSFDNCWQWIEEQLRQARIAENDWFKKAVEDEAVMIDDMVREYIKNEMV